MRLPGKLRSALAWAQNPLKGHLSWREYRSLCRQPLFTPGTARLMGMDLRYSDQLGFRHSVREIFVDEVYRFRANRDDPLIVDAGANIGLSVLYFKTLYPRSRIIAFEPDPEIFAMLSANVGGLPGVDLRCAAAATADGEVTFFQEGSLAGSTAIDFLGAGHKVTVAAQDLRPLIAGQRTDFLKIDIEGGENELIPHLGSALDQVDFLFFEYHGAAGGAQRLADLLSVVSASGLRYVINGVHAPARPFVERVEAGFEQQLNVSCFR